MKKIEAIVRKNKLESVKEALKNIRAQGMTVTDARGMGDEQGGTLCYRGAETKIDFVPRAKIELIVADGEVDTVVDAIFQVAHTGVVGDGQITVTPIESVTRIRTGEIEGVDTATIGEGNESQQALPETPATDSHNTHSWSGISAFSRGSYAALDYWAPIARS